MRPIDADALIEVLKKSMAENPHKEEMQKAMHIHEHKYFLTLLTSFPVIEGTTTDLISRQAAVELVMKYCPDDDGAVQCDGDIRGLLDELENLPSAQPEPKEGHWIPHETPDSGEQYECSRCGVLWEFNDGTPEDNEAYFCPKCGIKLATRP